MESFDKELPSFLELKTRTCLYHRIVLRMHVGVSENSVPLNPMVLLIIIPITWLFHWEYTQHFQTPMFSLCYVQQGIGANIDPKNVQTVVVGIMKFHGASVHLHLYPA